MSFGTVEKEAGDLVQRARLGDQNARAEIACIVEDSKKSPRAKLFADAIDKYINKHPIKSSFTMAKPAIQALKQSVHAVRPVTDVSSVPNPDDPNSTTVSSEDVDNFGIEMDTNILKILTCLEPLGGEEALTVGSVVLANGDFLDDSRISQLAGPLNEDVAKEFLFGVENLHCEPDTMFVRAGQVVGHARLLQITRLPDTPIAPFSEIAGKEFGECL
jgi:hypothetical protein